MITGSTDGSKIEVVRGGVTEGKYSIFLGTILNVKKNYN